MLDWLITFVIATYFMRSCAWNAAWIGSIAQVDHGRRRDEVQDELSVSAVVPRRGRTTTIAAMNTGASARRRMIAVPVIEGASEGRATISRTR